MSSWREGADQSPYKFVWRKQRDREIPEGDSKTKVVYFGSRLTWNLSLRHGEENTNRRSLERVAYAGSVLETTGGFQGQVQRFQSDHAGRPVVRLARFLQDRMGSSTESELFPLERCQNKLARRLLAMTRRNWDGEPNKQQTPIERATSKAWNCANWNGTLNQTLGTDQKSDRANPRRRLAPAACVGGNFWTDALG